MGNAHVFDSSPILTRPEPPPRKAFPPHCTHRRPVIDVGKCFVARAAHRKSAQRTERMRRKKKTQVSAQIHRKRFCRARSAQKEGGAKENTQVCAQKTCDSWEKVLSRAQRTERERRKKKHTDLCGMIPTDTRQRFRVAESTLKAGASAQEAPPARRAVWGFVATKPFFCGVLPWQSPTFLLTVKPSRYVTLALFSA